MPTTKPNIRIIAVNDDYLYYIEEKYIKNFQWDKDNWSGRLKNREKSKK